MAVLLGAIPLAASTPKAETPVGAHNLAVEVLVEPPQQETAGQRLGNDVAGLEMTVATGVATNTGVNGVRVSGQTGEPLAGIVKNTSRIPSASGRAAYRIPDELNSSVLGEVKNVRSLGYSSQIRDFHSYAVANDLEFVLYVRSSTVFRGQLAQLEQYGGLTRVNVPGL
ncbi:putative toxin [Nocardioides sp. 616]|uniref:putative toxin n=1 Tax=Nocardioides sp. 616 TaxID=2268090 RepID=UPI0013B3DB93|nr:putative toxin [Nocardioides sp. 616]